MPNSHHPVGHAFALLLAEPANSGSRQGIALGAALAIVFLLAYLIFGHLQFYHWNLSNGLLFAVLWALPNRWWPWLFGATIAARMLSGVAIAVASATHGPFLGYWADPTQFILGNLLEPFLVATGVLCLRRWQVSAREAGSGSHMALLHLAAAVSALAVTGKDLTYVLNDGFVADVRRGLIVDPVPLGGPGAWVLLAGFAIKNALGNFIGIMLVTPLAWWAFARSHRPGSKVILQQALAYLVPVVVVYVLLVRMDPQSQMAELLRLLLMVAVVVFALRHGWRGAAISLLAISLAIAIEDHLGHAAISPIWMQLFIAICGAIALMFGATLDDMRRNTRLLEQANQTTQHLAEALHAAASRNLQVEEAERRRLAAELHDEFGQNLTALQTHLSLAKRNRDSDTALAALDTLSELTREMRHNISGILERLQPAALQQLGLYGAIDRGAIRRLAEDAGIAFTTELQGDVRLLSSFDDGVIVAAYRLVQEAVTNVVRHAHASHCRVRLRIGWRNGRAWLFLEVTDDGVGRAARLRPGKGLGSMRDRVLALGGRLHVSDGPQGLRLHALLRDGYVSADSSPL